MKKIEVGSKVILQGEETPLEVTFVTEEVVEITRNLKVPYIRLYFGKEHKPVYSNKVKEILHDC